MTDKKLRGYLDRLRENVEVLDEQIENARAMSKKKDATALQWAKTLRDLLELRTTTLSNIKAHLLGRDETGVVKDPEDCWDENPQVMYERYFKAHLSPWTVEDLKLECADCGVKSEDVSDHYVEGEGEHRDLCEKCYDKRPTESSGESKHAVEIAEPASKGDIKAMLQSAALQIKVLRTFPLDQRIAKLEELLANKPEVAPGMEPAYEAYRAVLQKSLDNTKGAISANNQESEAE